MKIEFSCHIIYEDKAVKGDDIISINDVLKKLKNGEVDIDYVHHWWTSPIIFIKYVKRPRKK